MATMADKRQDFLWIVQMFMLRDTEVINWEGFAGDAVAASYRIPRNVTARDAALAFWALCSDRFRGGAEKEIPYWMSALSEPSYI